MIRNSVFIIILSFLSLFGFSRNSNEIDSLKQLLPGMSAEEQMNAYNSLAGLLRDSKLDESMDYAQKSLAIALKIDQPLGQAHAYTKLGWNFLSIQNYDSAKYYLNKSIEIGKENGDSHTLLNALTGLSDALSGEMKKDSAIVVLNNALEIARNIRSAPHLANVYFALGNVYHSISQPDTALSLYYLAKKYYQEAGNQSDLATVLNNIATVLMAAEKHEQALEYLKQALIINTKTDNVKGLMFNNSHTAVCYRNIGLPEQARQNLLENITLAKKHKLKADLAMYYMNLGNTLKDMTLFESAGCYYDSSLAICRALGIEYGILLNTINLGYLHQALNKYDSALYYFNKSLSIITDYDLKDEESKILLGIYECYKNTGTYDSALIYHEKYHLLRDTIYKVDVSQKIAELEGKYHQEKNLSKIALLNQDNYRIKAQQRLYFIGFISTLSLVIFLILYRAYKTRNKLLQASLVQKEKEKLEVDINAKQKELAVNAMHMLRINELSFDVCTELKKISNHVSTPNKQQIKHLIASLEFAAPQKAWKEFETRFENVHQDFYRVLNELYPELTPTEIKICSFIRLNMTTKDIAILTNRSIRTIESTRGSIRKKLNLGSNTSLSGHLLSI